MSKIWINRAMSFKEARAFDTRYYRSMSRAQRLETVQFLRERHRKFSEEKNEDRKRLRGFVKIIQQA